MTKSRLLLSLVLTLCVATIGFAQDEKKEKKKERVLTQTTKQILKSFEAAELTDEQQAKAKEIVGNHMSKLNEAKDALKSVLNEEQWEAKSAAYKKAKEDGLSGKLATEAVFTALNLSEEKLAEYKEISKKPQAVTKSIKDEIKKLLTEDQLAALPAPKKGKGKGKGKGKKEMKKEADTGTQTVSLKLPNMT